MTAPCGPVIDLVEQLKAGNARAAQELWERYYPRLVGLARKRLRGTSRRVADEEDVALSAFNSFCRGAEQGRFPSLSDEDNLWALLVGITVRKAVDLANHNRRQKRGGGKVRGDSALVGPEGGEGFDAVAKDELLPDVAAVLAEEFQALLDRLPDEEFRAIAVWKMEGYTNEEIGRRIKRSLATVERRLEIMRGILRRS